MKTATSNRYYNNHKRQHSQYYKTQETFIENEYNTIPEKNYNIANNRNLKIRKNKKTSKLAVPMGILFVLVVALSALFLVREEKVAAASAKSSNLGKDIEQLLKEQNALNTAYECSIDLDYIRKTASEKMNMGEWTEEQIRQVNYNSDDNNINLPLQDDNMATDANTQNIVSEKQEDQILKTEELDNMPSADEMFED